MVIYTTKCVCVGGARVDVCIMCDCDDDKPQDFNVDVDCLKRAWNRVINDKNT